MGKCFITKLDGHLDNTDLLKLGELRVKYILYNGAGEASAKSQKLTISTNGDEIVSIIGDGFFTDSSLQQNLGKTLDVSNVNNLSLYVSNSNCEVSFSNKYNIVEISSNWTINDSEWPTVEDRTTKSININDLKYSKHLTKVDLAGDMTTGDISIIENLPELKEFSISSDNNVTGDIKSVIGLQNLESFLVYECHNITGDISSFSGIKKIKNIAVTSDKVYGNIASINNLPELLSLAFSNLVGDISGLSNTKITSFSQLFKSALSGDFAILPNEFNYARFIDDKGSKFSWSTRPSSANIITIKGYVEFEDVDAMLKGQAQCTANGIDKIIEVKGNRTSASDNAILQLQSKGYTVSIA